jgi:integrase
MKKDGLSRRSYGSGSLFESNGRWYGKWRVDGRQIKRLLGPKRQPGSRQGLTRKQAEADLRQLMQEQQVRATSPDEAGTVAEAGRRLVRDLDVRGRKASTLAAYESTLRAHLVPHFGDRDLNRITTDDVEAFAGGCRAKGCAPKSIRNYLGALHAILDHAKVRPNPVADARKPEAEDTDPDIRFLSEEELDALLRAVPDDHLGPTDRALYLTAALTGLRQGELFGLRWRDIDWTAMRVRVRRSYARKRAGREAQFGRPKSKRSSRSVPMHDRVGAELERHFQRSHYTADDDLALCHPHTGGPLDHSRVLKRFKAALRTAAIRPILFHDLRHTVGTQMAAAGIPMRTLQEWMGHRDIKTTMIYADYAPSDHEREFVARAFRATAAEDSSQPPDGEAQLPTSGYQSGTNP